MLAFFLLLSGFPLLLSLFFSLFLLVRLRHGGQFLFLFLFLFVFELYIFHDIHLLLIVMTNAFSSSSSFSPFFLLLATSLAHIQCESHTNTRISSLRNYFILFYHHHHHHHHTILYHAIFYPSYLTLPITLYSTHVYVIPLCFSCLLESLHDLLYDFIMIVCFMK